MRRIRQPILRTARLVLRGFRMSDVDAVRRHFPRNPASGRVLEKLGMEHEGSLRAHVKKWGEYQDLECWGLLVRNFEERAKRDE